MTYADVLDNLMLMIAKFIKITIDFGQVHILVKMVFKYSTVAASLEG